MNKLVTMNSPVGAYELFGRSDDNSIIGTILTGAGDYESNVLVCIAEYCDENSVILDVGANIGALSVFFSKISHKGRVISFEPGRENFSFLGKNIQHNNCGNVSIINAGVSDYNGKAIFNYVSSVAGCSFISTSGVEEGLQEEVDIITLDSFLGELDIPAIDLIKLDVEGGELKVLKGAVESIVRYRPKLLVEWNPETMHRFYDTEAKDLYDFISDRWSNIFLISSDGKPVKIDGYAELTSFVEKGKGWEDLLCTF